MKPRYIASALLILIVVLTQGCEKIVSNVDLPQSKPKLVVFGYLAPENDTFTIRVTRSRPITEPQVYAEPLWVENATVRIREAGGQFITLAYDTESKNYYLPLAALPVFSGRQYQLTAQAPGLGDVSASTVVPPINTTLRITSLDSVMNQDQKKYNLRFEFTDPPGEPDFYRVYAYAIFEYRDPFNPEPYINETQMSIEYGSDLIDARPRDGEKFVITASASTWYWQTSFTERLIAFRIGLMTVDEHYYKFHRSYFNYEGDNPFAEPVIVYSNVSNGLGVVGSYVRYEVLLPRP